MAEFLGTAFLLAAVVGSGIMAERLASGSLRIALLANNLATGAALVALILLPSPAPTSTPPSPSPIAYGVELPGAKRQPIWLPRSPLLSVEWARRTSCSGCRCSPCPFTRGVGGPVVERVPRYLRIALGHLGMLSHSAHSSRLCRGSLYHCGVLVHGFDFICQSRGYTGPRCQRHLCRDSSG